MVGMKMRNQDGVDRRGRNTGSFEIGHHDARGVGDLTGGAGVDQDQLRAGVDQKHGERNRQDIGRQEHGSERAIDRGVVGVADELLVDLDGPQPVVQRGELVIAELAAIDARSLCGGLGGCGERGGAGQRRASARQ
jgi:hypothetical protein